MKKHGLLSEIGRRRKWVNLGQQEHSKESTFLLNIQMLLMTLQAPPQLDIDTFNALIFVS